MSAGKRLAKRSIVGTRVGALYKETGYYHPGTIIAVKNPDDPNVLQLNGVTISAPGPSSGVGPNSRYVVKFEKSAGGGDVREYGEGDLIGPGFKPMAGLKLRSGQKIFITYNGREVQGTVVYHQPAKDEVLINIQPQQLGGGSGSSTTNGSAAAPAGNTVTPVEIPIPIDVTKKLDEVRLIESRKSARLQEQDFDFARLADVAERKRTGSSSSGGSGRGGGGNGVDSVNTGVIISTNSFNGTTQQQQLQQSMAMLTAAAATSTATASIDVPRTNLSRKRRPSSGLLFQPVPLGLMQQQQQQNEQPGTSAATGAGTGPEDGTDECAAAMVLMSLSCSPHSPHWDSNGMISSSWSSSSSGASSWLSGASFGTHTNGIVIPSSGGPGLSSLSSRHSSSSHSNHSQRSSSSPAGGEFHHINNYSPTPSSSDDGIESDNGGNATAGGLTIPGSGIGTSNDVFMLGYCGANGDEPRKKKTKLIFKCTWPGCTMIKDSCFEIEAHVRYAHLGPQHDATDDHEEEFYYTEIEAPVTSSSSDYALSPSCSSSSPLGLNFLAFSPTLSHMDMVRPPSEDPEYKLSQLHNNIQRKSPNGTGNTHNFINASNNPKKRLSPKSSPVRRPRGDTKKCRKVYGMDKRELWCTQCKWKKACTRFSD